MEQQVAVIGVYRIKKYTDCFLRYSLKYSFGLVLGLCAVQGKIVFCQRAAL